MVVNSTLDMLCVCVYFDMCFSDFIHYANVLKLRIIIPTNGFHRGVCFLLDHLCTICYIELKALTSHWLFMSTAHKYYCLELFITWPELINQWDAFSILHAISECPVMNENTTLKQILDRVQLSRLATLTWKETSDYITAGWARPRDKDISS